MSFDIYMFVVSFIVMIALVVFFLIMIKSIITMKQKMIVAGLLDDEIKEEYIHEKKANKSTSKATSIIFGLVVPLLVSVALLGLTVFALVIKLSETTSVSVPKVVYTGSMASKNEKNKYLETNDLNDQIKRYDLIFLSPMPEQEDIKLYDVVAYQASDGTLIIHRIIKIEEVDGQTMYTFRGDSNESSDLLRVSYSQMKGIYKGNRVPFVGSIIVFFQSPAGWICMLLMVLVLIVLSIVEYKFSKLINDRYLVLKEQGAFECDNDSTAQSASEQENQVGCKQEDGNQESQKDAEQENATQKDDGQANQESVSAANDKEAGDNAPEQIEKGE